MVDQENISSEPKKMDKKKVLIHLCSAHVMKSFTKRLAKLTTDKKKKNFFAFVFARIINCTTLMEVTNIFSHLCDLALHKNYGEKQKVCV